MTNQTDIPEEFQDPSDKEWAKQDWKLDPQIKKAIEEVGPAFFSGTAEEERPQILEDFSQLAPQDVDLAFGPVQLGLASAQVELVHHRLTLEEDARRTEGRTDANHGRR